jgi:death on curing protein
VNVSYLDLEDVLTQHAHRIGPDLVRDRGQVAGTLARPASGFGDEEFYPTLAGKAASLLHGFATTQAFVDGNKRMAVYAATAFLLINGYRLTLGNVEMYDLAMGAAQGDLDVEKIGGSLESSMRPIDLDGP